MTENEVREFLRAHGWIMRIRFETDHALAPYVVRATPVGDNRTVQICAMADLDKETEDTLLKKIGAIAE